MNGRQFEILKFICESSNPVTLTSLSKQFLVSLRTIHNDFDEIDYELNENQIVTLKQNYKKGKGIILDEKEQKSIYTYIVKYNKMLDKFSLEDRTILIYLCIIFSKERITIAKLCDKFSASKGTIQNDLDRLRKKIEGKLINLTFSQRSGIQILGDENLIRDYAVQQYMEHAKVLNIFGADDYFRSSICGQVGSMRNIEDSAFIYNQGRQINNLLQKSITGKSFFKLLSYLETAIIRIKANHFIHMTKSQMDSLYETNEFKAIHTLFKNCSEYFNFKFDDKEVGYITLKLLGSNIVNYYPTKLDENYAEIQIMVCNLIRRVEKELNFNFSKDISMYNDLVFHLRTTIYRISSGIQQKNPLLKEIQSNYKEIYNSVKNNVSLIEKVVMKPLSEDEIAYIVLHFAAIVEKQRNTLDNVPNILIVCDSGIGTSNLLSARLTTIYDVNVVETAAVYEIDEMISKNKVDYILSTVSLKYDGKKVIHISPMISQQDMKVLDIYFQRRHAIALDQEKVLKTIARSCTIHDSQQLLEDLNKNFLIKFNVIKGKDCILMLKDVISKNMIELNFHAENWEEAVEEAGKLLMRGGCIDKEYIESMVNTVRTMGSYIVIAPGIALPHSRSGEHAHKVGISFLRLAEPVKFGHPENDPVDLIFGLSSIDNKSHLNALKDFSKILEEENNVEYLRQAKSTEQILNFLSSEGGVW